VSKQGEERDYASGLRAAGDPRDRWLSVYEAAAMVLQHPDTVRRWIADGLIEAEDRGRLGLRIPEREMRRYLAINFTADKRNPANHALSSNVVNSIPTVNQPRERDIAGAGWPFNHRVEDSGQPISRDDTGASHRHDRTAHEPTPEA
jgi:hypothetical protein